MFGINDPTWQVIIDDVVLVPAGTLFLDGQGNFPNSLGGIRFTSMSSGSTYYLGNINFCPDSCNLSVGDVASTINFVAFPNPATNLLTLRAEESIHSISIYNTLGQKVYSEALNSFTAEIDMTNFEKGVYFVMATVGNT